MARAISMSPKGFMQWQEAMQDLAINSAQDLVDAVVEGLRDDLAPQTPQEAKKKTIAPQTAEKAFTGKGVVDKPQWIKIFKALDLKWSTFFSAYEWEKLTPTDIWDDLLGIAEDANDRFGMVLAPRLQESGCRDALKTHRYEAVISKGDHVLVEFPADLQGFLLLLEQNAEGGFDLVAPSCLMQDSFLDGNLRRLPQYPPAPVQSIQLDSLGFVSVWAGVFDNLPQWDWLSGAEKDMLSLDVEQLDEVLAFAKSQTRATIWRSSYTVTAN